MNFAIAYFVCVCVGGGEEKISRNREFYAVEFNAVASNHRLKQEKVVNTT